MRLHRKKPSVNRGSALVITLFICTVLGTLVGSYLYLTGTQNISVTRSQRWHEALVVAEGGVEEALALMNSGVQTTNFAVNPWTKTASGVFRNATNRPGCKFGTSYYEVTITNAFLDANPVILATGYVLGPVGSPRLYRTLRVEAKPKLTFPVKGPMIVLQGFDANGSNVGTDSFDSTLGPYNPSAPSTNGDVVTLSTAPNSIAIGNATIRGNVRTPPGGTLGAGGTVTIQGGKVGDSTWISGSTSGVQPGHFQPNFTLSDFGDATLPNVPVWYVPGTTGTTAPDGLIYDRVLTSGNWKVTDLSGSVYVGQTNTVLWVDGSINISGGGGGAGYADPQIHIAAGASLTIYMSGATTTISGNGLVNDSAQAKNFAYYGLPSNTTINLTGNGAFYGTIYAPQADFNLKGSGNGSYDDFTGASVTKSTTMTGNFKFHYDEDLIHKTDLGGYDVASWAEL